METESNKTIFMGMPKPSDKCLFVSIPMNMYRIQTNKFTSGLNYFQKAVLRLKYMPQMSNFKIAGLLNLDERLVNKIVSELENNGLINNSGFITPKGEMIKNEGDGFIIDDKHTQIGYIFSYGKEDELFPYYQNSIEYAEINENSLIYNTDYGVKSVGKPLSVLNPHIPTKEPPNEYDILQLLKNTHYRAMDENANVENTDQGIFKFKYIPEKKPQSVNICTYIYLPQKANSDLYEDDWMVLDPFGNGDSYELKLFIEEEQKVNKALAKRLFETFKDAETEYNRRFDESTEWFEEQVEERIKHTFDEEKFALLNDKIKEYVKDVFESFMRMERNGFDNIKHSHKQLFFINMQTTIENILLQDQKDREEAYFDIEENYGEYGVQEDRQQILKAVFRKKILSENTMVPAVIYKSKTKSVNWKGKSLLNYLMKFIMSFYFEKNLEDCKIINVFKNRIDTIVGITEMRNHVGHETNKELEFTGHDAVDYYMFINELINDYIKIL